MHRRTVHKLTNWHIRQLSNTKQRVRNYLVYKYENRAQMHLCKNDNKQCEQLQ